MQMDSLNLLALQDQKSKKYKNNKKAYLFVINFFFFLLICGAERHVHTCKPTRIHIHIYISTESSQLQANAVNFYAQAATSSHLLLFCAWCERDSQLQGSYNEQKKNAKIITHSRVRKFLLIQLRNFVSGNILNKLKLKKFETSKKRLLWLQLLQLCCSQSKRFFLS